MVTELLEPPLHILKGGMLGNIVDEESTDSTTVVGGGDSAVTFLTGRVPDLGLDGFSLSLDGFGGEFDSDGGFGFEVEFVACEAGEEVGFSNSGVANEDYFEEVIVFFVYSCHFVCLCC